MFGCFKTTDEISTDPPQNDPWREKGASCTRRIFDHDARSTTASLSRWCWISALFGVTVLNAGEEEETAVEGYAGPAVRDFADSVRRERLAQPSDHPNIKLLAVLDTDAVFINGRVFTHELWALGMRTSVA